MKENIEFFGYSLSLGFILGVSISILVTVLVKGRECLA